MDPILNSVYGAILPSAPYVIAAYALIWVALFVFVAIIVRNTRKNERDLELLEKAMEKIEDAGKDDAPGADAK